VSSTDRGLPLGRTSRLALVAFWAMVACGVVSGLAYVAPLPKVVMMTVLITLPISVLGWAAAVFRDSRETGSSLGQAAWKSIKLSWRAVWELVP